MFPIPRQMDYFSSMKEFFTCIDKFFGCFIFPHFLLKKIMKLFSFQYLICINIVYNYYARLFRCVMQVYLYLRIHFPLIIALTKPIYTHFGDATYVSFAFAKLPPEFRVSRARKWYSSKSSVQKSFFPSWLEKKSLSWISLRLGS